MELLDEVARFSPALEVCGSEIKRDLMNALARSQAPHQPQLGTCVAEIVGTILDDFQPAAISFNSQRENMGKNSCSHSRGNQMLRIGN